MPSSRAGLAQRARRFWDQRQRRAKPGELTGYLLDGSPAAVGRHRFEGEWAQVKGWLSAEKGAGGACLDLGCGTGRWLLALAPHFERIEGWDYAPAMVAASRAALKAESVRHAKLACGDITRRKGRAEFDLIFVGGVLMYTPEAALAPLLKALRRLLKPGGLLILRESTQPGATLIRQGQALRPGFLGDEASEASLDYVAVYRSREALSAALGRAGFTLERVAPNAHYKLSDLTEDRLRQLDGLVGGALKRNAKWAETAAEWIYRLRWLTLYPEYYLRRWKLRNYWFLARA